METDQIVIALLVLFVILILYKSFSAGEHMSHKKTLVFFYADWCGYCKRFWPVWDEFKKKHNSVRFVEIPDKEAALYKVNGFPTIRLYNGKPSPGDFSYKEYSGDRSIDSLKQFII